METEALRKVKLICWEYVSCELSMLGAWSQRSDVQGE